MPEKTPKPETTATRTTEKDLEDVSGGVPLGYYVVQGQPPQDPPDDHTPDAVDQQPT